MLSHNVAGFIHFNFETKFTKKLVKINVNEARFENKVKVIKVNIN